MLNSWIIANRKILTWKWHCDNLTKWFIQVQRYTLLLVARKNQTFNKSIMRQCSWKFNVNHEIEMTIHAHTYYMDACSCSCLVHDWTKQTHTWTQTMLTNQKFCWKNLFFSIHLLNAQRRTQALNGFATKVIPATVIPARQSYAIRNRIHINQKWNA